MRIYFKTLRSCVLIYTLIAPFKNSLQDDIFKISFHFLLSGRLTKVAHNNIARVRIYTHSKCCYMSKIS
jgi:hypothetical protein